MVTQIIKWKCKVHHHGYAKYNDIFSNQKYWTKSTIMVEKDKGSYSTNKKSSGKDITMVTFGNLLSSLTMATTFIGFLASRSRMD